MKKTICLLIAIFTVISMGACTADKSGGEADTTASTEALSDSENAIQGQTGKSDVGINQGSNDNRTAVTADKSVTVPTTQSSSMISREKAEELVYFAAQLSLLSDGFDPATADPKQLLTEAVNACIVSVFLSDEYFPNRQSINYNYEPDPLRVFWDTSLEDNYTKIPQSDVEWLLINVLNLSEEKVYSVDWTDYTSNPEDYDWFTLYYYQGYFYFGKYVIAGATDGFGLSSYEMQADGSYIVRTDYNDFGEFKHEGPTIFAKEKTVDGRKIWSITKVVK